jgi:hypothetical protein
VTVVKTTSSRRLWRCSTVAELEATRGRVRDPEEIRSRS